MSVTINLTWLLSVIVFLQLKHLVVDFYLQPPYMHLNKGILGHPGGLIHAGLHAAVTYLGLCSLPLQSDQLMLVAITEFAIHYLTDFAKININRVLELTPAKKQYWELLGVDQCVHQLNYVLIVWLLIFYGALNP